MDAIHLKVVKAMSKTDFICTLSTKDQLAIKQKLESAGLDSAEIEVAMNSRLCDIEDTITL